MAWPEESGSLGVIRAEKPPSRRPGGVRSRVYATRTPLPLPWTCIAARKRGREKREKRRGVFVFTISLLSSLLSPLSSLLSPLFPTRGKPRRYASPFPIPSRCFTQAAMRGTYYLDARGKYRVFNEAGYKFYRSDSAPPTEDDTPFATSATLPHTPADTYADGTWYLSASYFNGVIDSGFLPLGPHGETYLRLDLTGGQATGSPPGGPADFRLELLAAGVVRVVAVYCETGENRAEEWAIAYTTDGADPPEDNPTISQEITGGILDVLAYDLPAQSHATTVKVRLQTRREDSSWVYSENSTVLTATADAQGPAAPESAEKWKGRKGG